MKKIAILQSNYIPWKGYFDLINMVDEFIIYDEVQYTKNDWRNRNKIKTKAGVQWITIPVTQKTINQRIDETQVALNNWAGKHWKTLIANYTQAPYFKFYKPVFEEFYLNNKFEHLSKINLSLILLINDLLGIKTKISSSLDYKTPEGKNERLVELVSKAGGTEYISGPSAKSYINEDLFSQANIKITWMDYSGYVEYPQLYPPFDHAVSILDLIFNTGPDSFKYMKSFN